MMSIQSGVSRRNFLKVGAAGVGGLTLADLLRAEAAAGTGSSNKALINIHLAGGPSHQDTFDLKPDAPSEYRGEFNPISTNAPGLDICEHFPMLAQSADKFSVIRSLTGSIADHSDYPTQTGFPRSSLQSLGGRPSIGSVVSKLQGDLSVGAPPFVGYNGSYVGYLGAVHQPFRPQGGELRLNKSVTADRLRSRTDLLGGLDRLRRDMDHTGHMLALDAYSQQAVEMVTSGRVADALDLSKEDPRLRERYGNDGKMFLTARRLIEAGVRVVNFNWGSWDTHSNNFGHLRNQLPKLDRSMHALLEDLSVRGLNDDVTVVMWGEFGRTPRVNSNKGGRDHWYEVAMCFLAGGGMKMGQAIGKSNRNAERAVDRPVHLLEVMATLYHNLGIDVKSTTITDPAGRPQYLVDHREPIRELI
ncbi:MAG: DUF1501 domain-containing protein [Planctomycetaceae bacterium]|jgi:hypothetical protein|nr:DUF1501 domain-containing protein [Planctomycetaceae bacterium]MBT6496134.1 DUF1501 domain-containing protein [Planctomycetaceae bacterium]